MICGYSSTLVSSGAAIDRFYSDFRDIPRKVNKDFKNVLMGDFNARVGCDDAAWSTLDRHSTGKCNSNGILLLQLSAVRSCPDQYSDQTTRQV